VFLFFKIIFLDETNRSDRWGRRIANLPTTIQSDLAPNTRITPGLPIQFNIIKSKSNKVIIDLDRIGLEVMTGVRATLSGYLLSGRRVSRDIRGHTIKAVVQKTSS
jgi:hypothetical protein